MTFTVNKTALYVIHLIFTTNRSGRDYYTHFIFKFNLIKKLMFICLFLAFKHMIQIILLKNGLAFLFLFFPYYPHLKEDKTEAGED
jgi:hypothetical protein